MIAPKVELRIYIVEGIRARCVDRFSPMGTSEAMFIPSANDNELVVISMDVGDSRAWLQVLRTDEGRTQATILGLARCERHWRRSPSVHDPFAAVESAASVAAARGGLGAVALVGHRPSAVAFAPLAEACARSLLPMHKPTRASA